MSSYISTAQQLLEVLRQTPNNPDTVYVITQHGNPDQIYIPPTHSQPMGSSGKETPTHLQTMNFPGNEGSSILSSPRTGENFKPQNNLNPGLSRNLETEEEEEDPNDLEAKEFIYIIENPEQLDNLENSNHSPPDLPGASSSRTVTYSLLNNQRTITDTLQSDQIHISFEDPEKIDDDFKIELADNESELFSPNSATLGSSDVHAQPPPPESNVLIMDNYELLMPSSTVLEDVGQMESKAKTVRKSYSSGKSGNMLSNVSETKTSSGQESQSSVKYGNKTGMVSETSASTGQAKTCTEGFEERKKSCSCSLTTGHKCHVSTLGVWTDREMKTESKVPFHRSKPMNWGVTKSRVPFHKSKPLKQGVTKSKVPSYMSTHLVPSYKTSPVKQGVTKSKVPSQKTTPVKITLVKEDMTDISDSPISSPIKRKQMSKYGPYLTVKRKQGSGNESSLTPTFLKSLIDDSFISSPTKRKQVSSNGSSLTLKRKQMSSGSSLTPTFLKSLIDDSFISSPTKRKQVSSSRSRLILKRKQVSSSGCNLTPTFIKSLTRCDLCNQSFASLAHLRKHLKDHTTHRRFVCDICYSTFVDKKSHEYHMRSHNSDRRFQCEFCLKKFIKKSHLTEHTRIHTQEKTYQCEVCAKMFSSSGRLAIHKNKHAEVKQFACEICLKSFSFSSSLTRHMYSHSGIKRYQCAFCGAEYRHREDLKKHEAKHLKGEPIVRRKVS